MRIPLMLIMLCGRNDHVRPELATTDFCLPGEWHLELG
jgi:hypothetical protein